VDDIDEAIELLSADADSLQGEDAAARDALEQQLQDLRGLRATQSDTTIVVEPAVPASAPVSPRPARNTALAAVFALLLAAGLVPLLDRLDRRIRDVSELEDLIDEPVLAMIPTAAFPGEVPSAAVREAFQILRASLTYFNLDRSLATVLVTSANQGEGKTTVATNLAVAMAVDEHKVVLVDGDFRKAQAARRLGIDPGPGIEPVLFEDVPLEDALVPVPIEGATGAGELQVLPCAAPPPNPSVLLGSKRMKALLAELAERAEIVIIDAPPELPVSDVIPLLEQVSGTVLVTRLDHTTRDAVLKTRQVIESAKGSILGTVVTGTETDVYGYGYGETYPEDSEPAPAVEGNGQGAGRRGLAGVLRRDKS
jgi:capsular exopolysaccharide synthesis family protein